jgi:predicted transposase/invertase (TIGR01784 family)
MNQAIEAYRTITVSPEFQEQERMRSKTRHNEASALGHARREGERKGMLKGERKSALAIARNALELSIPIDDIIKITGLSRKEIEVLQQK